MIDVDVGLGAQRIEIVEIGDARQQRHGDADRRAVAPALGPRQGRRRPRPAGRRASSNHGTTPRLRQAGALRDDRERRRRTGARSPRNLLTMKPLSSARSAGSSSARVPTRLAIRRRGRCRRPARPARRAASAKPMLAMSPARRLISAGLPAPSTRTRSASPRAARSSPAPSAAASASARDTRAACALPSTRPCTTTCAPVSVCGFSSTGFMWTDGATPQARACSAWARPISPPSAVTAALFDMFCGLNGRTRRPRRVKARARPATISDLPTWEPVPWIMMAAAVMVRTRSPSAPSRRSGTDASPSPSR